MNLKEFTSASRPRLLVSVRNAAESRAAVEGGAEIIDVKEPLRGSLGKADDRTLHEIAGTVQSLDTACPLSAALGELSEWQTSPTSPTLPRLPQEIRFVKLGFSRCAENKNWIADWQDFRDQLGERNVYPLDWIAVIYADWQAARAPAPEKIFEAVAETACSGVLVDTFRKDGRSLLEVLPMRELSALAGRVHRLGLPLAIAGGLRNEDLPRIRSLSPEIIAIRSAACSEGKRNGPICPAAIQGFRNHLNHCLWSAPARRSFPFHSAPVPGKH